MPSLFPASPPHPGLRSCWKLGCTQNASQLRGCILSPRGRKRPCVQLPLGDSPCRGLRSARSPSYYDSACGRRRRSVRKKGRRRRVKYANPSDKRNPEGIRQWTLHMAFSQLPQKNWRGLSSIFFFKEIQNFSGKVKVDLKLRHKTWIQVKKCYT